MARAAFLHLLRSQSSHHFSKNAPSAYHCFRSLTRGQPISANPIFKASSQLVIPQRRWASEATTTEEDNKVSFGPRSAGQSGEGDKETVVVYHDPFSDHFQKFKLLSLSYCCLLVGCIFFLASSDMNVIMNDALATPLISLTTTVTVTATFNWFLGPYIHKLRWQPGTDSFEVKTVSWLATRKTVKFADIRPPGIDRPFVTFKANGNLYYIDAARCDNEALLARLTLAIKSNS